MIAFIYKGMKRLQEI